MPAGAAESRHDSTSAKSRDRYSMSDKWDGFFPQIAGQNFYQDSAMLGFLEIGIFTFFLSTSPVLFIT